MSAGTIGLRWRCRAHAYSCCWLRLISMGGEEFTVAAGTLARRQTLSPGKSGRECQFRPTGDRRSPSRYPSQWRRRHGWPSAQESPWHHLALIAPLIKPNPRQNRIGHAVVISRNLILCKSWMYLVICNCNTVFNFSPQLLQPITCIDFCITIIEAVKGATLSEIICGELERKRPGNQANLMLLVFDIHTHYCRPIIVHYNLIYSPSLRSNSNLAALESQNSALLLRRNIAQLAAVYRL